MTEISYIAERCVDTLMHKNQCEKCPIEQFRK